MTNVVERLRDSVLRTRDEEAAKGRKDGCDWARNEADALQLQRLADARDQAGHEWRQWFGLDGASSSHCAAEIFLAIIDPEEADRHQVSGFWEDVLGEDIGKVQEDEYVFAFANGALQLWDVVLDAI